MDRNLGSSVREIGVCTVKVSGSKYSEVSLSNVNDNPAVIILFWLVEISFHNINSISLCVVVCLFVCLFVINSQ